MFSSEVPTSVYSEHDTDDDLVEETEEQEQARIKERNANATAQNMPKFSTPTSRKSWPPVWLQEWDRQELIAEESQTKTDRHKNRPTKPQIVKAIRVLGLNHLDPSISIEEKLSDECVKKWFKELYTKFAVDKMEASDTRLDPFGVDCTTRAKREQAWLNRAQDLIAAKTDLLARNKYGARMNHIIEKDLWV